jgi:hypothetical protein
MNSVCLMALQLLITYTLLISGMEGAIEVLGKPGKLGAGRGRYPIWEKWGETRVAGEMW